MARPSKPNVLQTFQIGHVLYNKLFLRLGTFNSESYSVHVVSLCVRVRVPNVCMRQLGDFFFSFLHEEIIFESNYTKESLVSQRAVANAHLHLKEEVITEERIK